jgi:hypothetical protein
MRACLDLVKHDSSLLLYQVRKDMEGRSVAVALQIGSPSNQRIGKVLLVHSGVLGPEEEIPL